MPYLAFRQVYNRFGAARLSQTAILDNTLGGCDGDAANSSLAAAATKPRYRKVAVDWKAEHLGDGVERVRAWLEARRCSPGRFVVLDVLVPTVRYDSPPHFCEDGKMTRIRETLRVILGLVVIGSSPPPVYFCTKFTAMSDFLLDCF